MVPSQIQGIIISTRAIFFLNEPHNFDDFMTFWNERSIIMYFVFSVWMGSSIYKHPKYKNVQQIENRQ